MDNRTINQIRNNETKLINEIKKLEQENNRLWKQKLEYIDRISRAIEYINHYETIRGYYEYEENGYDEYNYENDLKQELLEILEDKEVE